LGHDVASHTHCAFTHRCPLEQEGPAPHPIVHVPPTQLWPVAQTFEPPHRHAPATHESERFESHAVQAAPAEPHALALAGRQVVPSQHPEGQLVASQPAPASHAPPAHVVPASLVPPSEVTQAVPSQREPDGQLG